MGLSLCLLGMHSLIQIPESSIHTDAKVEYSTCTHKLLPDTKTPIPVIYVSVSIRLNLFVCCSDTWPPPMLLKNMLRHVVQVLTVEKIIIIIIIPQCVIASLSHWSPWLGLKSKKKSKKSQSKLDLVGKKWYWGSPSYCVRYLWHQKD